MAYGGTSEEKRNQQTKAMKDVLIIAYYWPPAGGPGVQRWLKFVKYFQEFGIAPTVYVPDNPHYPITDTTLETDIPKDITILRKPIKEPYQLANRFSKKKTAAMSSGIIAEKKQGFMDKLMLYVRGNFFIPDARVGWVKPSVAFLQKYISEKNIPTIITTGPPHSLHLIGLELKNKLDINWIADFRDPWTTIHYHKSLRLSNAAARKHKTLEREVLSRADQIVVTSMNTKTEFSVLTQKPISVITNGFDPSQDIEVKRDAKFSMVHIGSLLSERNPETLWTVLSELIQTQPRFKNSLAIKLVGTVSEVVLDSLTRHGLDPYVVTTGYVSHSEARQLQHNAQLLLLLEIDRIETRSIIPGKLFEYMEAKRPVLAIGPKGSDIAALLKESGSGRFFTPQSKTEIKTALETWFSQYEKGELAVPSTDISKYSRRSLTADMAQIIKSF